jgi:F0F1-type ATP synthase membrane subunit b/b'
MMDMHSVIIPVKKLVFGFANFGVFFGFLIYVLRKPIAKFFVDRKNAFLDSKKEAESLYDNAYAENQAVTKKLLTLDADADEVAIKIKEQAVLNAEKVVAQANAQAEYIKKETAEILESEKLFLIKDTKNRLINKVVSRAKSELGTEVDSGKRRSYLNSYSKSVEGRS